MKECWLYLLQPSILKKSRGFGKSHHFFVKFKIYSTYTKKKTILTHFKLKFHLLKNQLNGWLLLAKCLKNASGKVTFE